MFEQVKQEIDDKIKTNGNNEITATRLNGVLQDMMDASAEVIGEVQQSIDDQVEANPTGEATTHLNKIKIGGTNYKTGNPFAGEVDATDAERLQALANVSNQTANSTTGKMGYVVLQPEIEGDATTTFAAQIANKPNTIVEIKDVFDLGNEIVEIPDGCILNFNGGRLYNGTLKGNGTVINAQPVAIFGENIGFNGTFVVEEIYSEWFRLDNDFDDTLSIQKAYNASKIMRGSGGADDRGTIKLLRKAYNISCSTQITNSPNDRFVGNNVVITALDFFDAKNFRLVGSGRENTIINVTKLDANADFKCAILLDRYNNIEISDFTIKTDAPKPTFGTPSTISVTDYATQMEGYPSMLALQTYGGGRELYLKNINVSCFNNAVDMSYSSIICNKKDANGDTNTFENCTFDFCNHAIYIIDNSQSVCNRVSDCDFFDILKSSVCATSFNTWYFDSLTIISPSPFIESVEGSIGYFGSSVSNIITMNNCKFEYANNYGWNPDTNHVYVVKQGLDHGKINVVMTNVVLSGGMNSSLHEGEYNWVCMQFGVTSNVTIIGGRYASRIKHGVPLSEDAEKNGAKITFINVQEPITSDKIEASGNKGYNVAYINSGTLSLYSYVSSLNPSQSYNIPQRIGSSLYPIQTNPVDRIYNKSANAESSCEIKFNGYCYADKLYIINEINYDSSKKFKVELYRIKIGNDYLYKITEYSFEGDVRKNIIEIPINENVNQLYLKITNESTPSGGQYPSILGKMFVQTLEIPNRGNNSYKEGIPDVKNAIGVAGGKVVYCSNIEKEKLYTYYPNSVNTNTGTITLHYAFDNNTSVDYSIPIDKVYDTREELAAAIKKYLADNNVPFDTADQETRAIIYVPLDATLTVSDTTGAGSVVSVLSNGESKHIKEYDGAESGVLRSGDTASRPSGDKIYIGFMYFDTSLSPAKMIVWNGTSWVNLDGTALS